MWVTGAKSTDYVDKAQATPTLCITIVRFLEHQFARATTGTSVRISSDLHTWLRGDRHCCLIPPGVSSRRCEVKRVSLGGPSETHQSQQIATLPLRYAQGFGSPQ